MSTNVGAIDLEMLLNSNPYNKTLKEAESSAQKSGNVIEGTFKKVGKVIAAAFAIDKIVSFGKECVQVATETSNAWIGLNSVLTGQQKSFQKAKDFINDYISDGLVPLNNAVAAYKNLTLRGYSSDQIQKTMNALKNSATFARQSTYTLGDAVQTATEGLKNENSVVVDNAGVTKNVAKMWEEYAKSIGKTVSNLTQAEKIQAEVNGILEETKFQSNDAAIYASTFSGKVAQLNTAFTNMKVAIGNVIQPIAKLFIPIITSAISAVTKLFTALAGLMSMFGLKADSVETVSNGINDIATGASNASDSIGDVGKSAKKAAKDLKSLASFDTAQILKSSENNSGSGSGSGTGSNGGTGGIVESLDVTSRIKEDTNAFDGIISKLKELVGIFKNGFDASFGSTNFDGILTHLSNIKKSLINIWKSPEVIGAAQEWIKTSIYALGQFTGAIARIGINITEGFLGSIDKYLSQNGERIKEHILNMFRITGKDIQLTGDLWQALGEISDVFSGDIAKQIGADFIAMFTNPLMSIKEFIAKFATDFRAIFVQPIIDNSEKIKNSIEKTLGPVQKMTGTMSEVLTYIGDKFNEVYDNYIGPFMNSLKTGLSDTFGKFLDIYNEYVVPFLDDIATGLSSLWGEHLKPLTDKLGELFGSVMSLLQTLWEVWLKPLIDWIGAKIVPVIVPILKSLWNTVKKVIGSISDILSGVIDFLKGIIDFVVGVFSGDWDKAWSSIKAMTTAIWNIIESSIKAVWEAIVGIIDTAINIVKGVIKTALDWISLVWNNGWNSIKNFVSGIWNGIKNIFSGIGTWFSNKFQEAYNGITKIFSKLGSFFSGIWNGIKKTFSNLGTNIGNAISNAVKSGINGVISLIEKTINRAINLINGGIGLINLIPGVNIGKINQLALPRLAEGGYVKANTPQLAMIGDNRHQGEIVSPEDKLAAIYKKVNKEMGLGNNQKVIELLELIIQILSNLPFDFNLFLDSYELETRLEKVKNKRTFATNGG